MQEQSNHDQPVDHWTECLVVLQALGRGERDGAPLERVRAELSDIEPARVEDAIASLRAAGVVLLDDGRLHLSDAAQRLDELAMIAI
jgi:hypothetical protein